MLPTVKVGDINMYYEVHGQGEPLLLIAGLGMDLTGWMFQIPEFSKKYQVVAFDNRGAGRTDAPDKPCSIRMMADDTAGLMDALRIDGAHILGISMGGCIAQELAINHPRKVKSLILADTMAAASHGVSLMADHAFVAAVMEGVSRRTHLMLQLPFMFTASFLRDSTMVQMALDTMMANPYPQQAYAYARQVAALVEHDARARLSQIRAPTLVLVGSEDIAQPVKMSEELAAGIPNAKLAVQEGGAHVFCAEMPDKFNRLVLDFLVQIA